jgi:hypothetical protein
MSNFNAAFLSRLESLRDSYARRKAKFADAINFNAAEAIKDHASAVAELQYELSAFDYVHNVYLSKVGSTYRNSNEAAEAAIASLKQHVLILATDGEYSSGIYNAVSRAELVGTRDAIDQLEYINNHPAA